MVVLSRTQLFVLFVPRDISAKSVLPRQDSTAHAADTVILPLSAVEHAHRWLLVTSMA